MGKSKYPRLTFALNIVGLIIISSSDILPFLSQTAWTAIGVAIMFLSHKIEFHLGD